MNSTKMNFTPYWSDESFNVTDDTYIYDNTSYFCFVEIGDIVWFEVTITMICGFGIIGNILNLIILNGKKLYASVDRMERSANMGFVALALSDLMFCIVAIPTALLIKLCKTDHAHLVILYIRTYCVPITNLFLMISTWLIVAMAITRYFVVCKPLKARKTMDASKTRLIIMLVYILSIILTAPHFALNIILPIQDEGAEVFIMGKLEDIGLHDVHLLIQTYVVWVWPILADFIPFLILVCFNIRLHMAIRKSDMKRRAHCPGQKVPESSRRVTMTLIIIIIMHIALVSPAEIMKYISSGPFKYQFSILVALIANVFQTLNFASNFVLYISVNGRFRQTSKDMVKKCLQQNADEHKAQYSAVSRSGESWL